MRPIAFIFPSGRQALRSVLAWLGGWLLCAAMAQTGLEHYGESGNETVTAWRRLLEESRPLPMDEQLQAVNQFFNRRLRFTTDQAAWGVSDYWATPIEFMRRSQGDCEEFAIAKYVSLLMLGVPSERLRLIYVRARLGSAASGNSEAHMVLGYYADPTGEPLLLDNLVNGIRPAASRPDLTPVFSFNTQGLWVPGSEKPAAADPTARLSRWRDLLSRMKTEGVKL
ncbi:transglutaminase-like cysteine peptidase [Malikia sp.]|uniref:transglutaminase-like cysteine peptidase n=1 Tax=Malikia sp. TaxID=2070706 RepID=UPI00260580AC|nr:transglutaminase-like cysteine peptidase [Malikia sp.]MDD2727759.1 transglutaminase-like cysteine peptidase [Malikia sp.]